MKQSVLFFLLFGLFIQIVSCIKSDPKPSPAPPPIIPPDTTVVKKDTTEDVYIVGAIPTHAGYWKNAQFIPVSTAQYTYAIDMAFSGSDIYVLGAVNDSNGYWKNGQFSFLAKNDTLIPTSI